MPNDDERGLRGRGTQETVRAAGAIPWREGPDGTEVLVIHRPKYDDWSWPKGKLDPGETDEVAARREVEEETGLRGLLGGELGQVSYRDRRGRPKRVRYFELSDPEGEFEPSREVDEVRWVPPEAARELLSYAWDIDLLDRLLLRHRDNLDRRAPVHLATDAPRPGRLVLGRGAGPRSALPAAPHQGASDAHGADHRGAARRPLHRRRAAPRAGARSGRVGDSARRARPRPGVRLVADQPRVRCLGRPEARPAVGAVHPDRREVRRRPDEEPDPRHRVEPRPLVPHLPLDPQPPTGGGCSGGRWRSASRSCSASSSRS